MSTLSGQTIQSTYQGLLKLADSTTGITNTYQQVQDGLGNNTGILVKNNYIFDNTHITKTIFKPLSLGTGLSNTGTGAYGNISNFLCAIPFWDNGQYSYSSITVNVRTVSATETFSLAFYNSQLTSKGLLPKDLILSGITIPVTTLNQRTVTFPSTLTFSATPGINWFVFKITSGSASPALRLAGPGIGGGWNRALANNYGFESSGHFYQLPATTLISTNTTNTYSFSGITNFATSFSEATITNGLSATITGNQQPYGFLLNLI